MTSLTITSISIIFTPPSPINSVSTQSQISSKPKKYTTKKPETAT